jgi:hypothetical protein
VPVTANEAPAAPGTDPDRTTAAVRSFELGDPA